MEKRKAMSVSEAVASRFACRDYLSKEVSLDLVMKILDEARRAPSSANLQPWKIYLVHGENRKKLTNIIKTKIDNGVLLDLPIQFPFLPGVPAPLPQLLPLFKQKFPKYYQRHAALGKLVYTSQGVKRGDHKKRMEKAFRGFEFWGAPIGLIFTIHKDMTYGQYPDIGILLQTIMLLCQQYGLSTCSMILWSMQHETVKKALNIDPNQTLFCGMSIGYKNDKAPVNQIKTERMTLDEMVVVAQVNENITIGSPYVFKAKLGMTIAQCYLSKNLPYLAVALGSVAIGVGCWFRYKKKR